MNVLEAVFTTVLNMSITASFVAIGVMLVRLILKKMPRIFSYALWSVVLVRLIIPVSFTSTFSLLNLIKPRTQHTNGTLSYVPYNIGIAQTPSIDVGVDGISKAVNSSLPHAVPTASANPMQIVMAISSIVWIVGVALLILYSIISYLKVKQNIRTATLVSGNIFETDRIDTPFVCGFYKPKIYIPINMPPNELPYILAHERVHLKRLDYIIKPFAFLVLSVHWFNPLMWLSFSLMSRDMEMSCDESVLKMFGDEIRVSYSNSLLAFSTGRSQLLSGSPLTFGESNAKMRIKNILNYKKPTFQIFMIALVATVAFVILFLANPKHDPAVINNDSGYKMETLMANKTQYVGDNSKVVALIDAMPLPAGVVRDSVEIQTSTKPYAIIIHYTVNEEKNLGSSFFFRNAVMLLGLVENVDVIYGEFFYADKNSFSHTTAKYPFTREMADQWAGGDVRNFARSTETLNALIDRLSNDPVLVANPNSSKDYQSVVYDFLKQKNLKIAMNSGAAEDIQLPDDFNFVKDSVSVGELLRQRNELSKQNNLDFSNYMGQKVKMYTAQIETSDPKSNYDVVLFIADNKVIGFWNDAGIKDPKQNYPDFNSLLSLMVPR